MFKEPYMLMNLLYENFEVEYRIIVEKSRVQSQIIFPINGNDNGYVNGNGNGYDNANVNFTEAINVKITITVKCMVSVTKTKKEM